MKILSDIAIICGLHDSEVLDDVEVISIRKDSISHINSTIPSLPKGLCDFSGVHLPNGDLVVCGGSMRSRSDRSDDYLHYNRGSNIWTKVGTMITDRIFHSSVWIEDCILTTGGRNMVGKVTSCQEEFSFHGGFKERKKLPIALSHHTATIFDQNKIIVCGGYDGRVRKIV